jgi:hypothetical protein
MQGPEDHNAEFLDTVVLDLEIQGALSPLDYDGGTTDVLCEEMLRLIQQELE